MSTRYIALLWGCSMLFGAVCRAKSQEKAAYCHNLAGYSNKLSLHQGGGCCDMEFALNSYIKGTVCVIST
jgi:hypothetical protein